MPDQGIDLHIGVANFATSSYRAAIRIGGKPFVGASRADPAAAVQQLFLQVGGGSGSWTDDALMAIELELMGESALQRLLGGPEKVEQ